MAWVAEVHIPTGLNGNCDVHMMLHGDSQEDAGRQACYLAQEHGSTYQCLISDRDSEPVWLFVNPSGLTMGFANVFETED